MSENQLVRTVSSVDLDKPHIDEKGELYFFKTSWKMHRPSEWSTQWQRVEGSQTVEKVTTEQCGYVKELETEIFIEKTVSSSESLENEKVYFKMLLTISVPKEKAHKFEYLYKTSRGAIILKNFESGSGSAININDVDFVKRGRARKLPANSYLPKTAQIFTISGDGSQTLERRLK